MQEVLDTLSCNPLCNPVSDCRGEIIAGSMFLSAMRTDERSVFRRGMLTALGYYFRHGVLGFKLRDPFKWTFAAAGDPEYASQVIGLPVAAFAICCGCYRIASAGCGAARGRAETCARGCFGVFEIPAINGLHQAGRR